MVQDMRSIISTAGPSSSYQSRTHRFRPMAENFAVNAPPRTRKQRKTNPPSGCDRPTPSCLGGVALHEMSQCLCAADLAHVGLSSKALAKVCLAKALQLNQDLVDVCFAVGTPHAVLEKLRRGADPNGWTHKTALTAFTAVVSDLLDCVNWELAPRPAGDQIAILQLLISHGLRCFRVPTNNCLNLISILAMAIKHVTLSMVPEAVDDVAHQVFLRYQMLLGVLVGHALTRGGKFHANLLQQCFNEEDFNESIYAQYLPDPAAFRDVMTHYRGMLQL